jgi:hypothetical protein
LTFPLGWEKIESEGGTLKPAIKIRGAINMDVKKLPQVNIVNPKLEQIRGLGLYLHDNGKTYDTYNYDAREYAQDYLQGNGYTLGNVMADTESLQMAEYDVCFVAIESKHKGLSSEDYQNLHKLAEQNNAYNFIRTLVGMGNEDSVYHSIAEDVYDYMVEIENELDQIILALGGTINELPRA